MSIIYISVVEKSAIIYRRHLTPKIKKSGSLMLEGGPEASLANEV